MSLEPDSITKPLPRGKTATIPMEVLQAFIESHRATGRDLQGGYLHLGAKIFANYSDDTYEKYLKLRDLLNEVKL